jgi:hypothetical protein
VDCERKFYAKKQERYLLVVQTFLAGKCGIFVRNKKLFERKKLVIFFGKN